MTPRPIASTNYGGWVEVECTQMCGWKPEKQASSEAVRHVRATGHETAVKHHSSIHYHVRWSDEKPTSGTESVR